jgi:hypothetical protein
LCLRAKKSMGSLLSYDGDDRVAYPGDFHLMNKIMPFLPTVLLLGCPDDVNIQSVNEDPVALITSHADGASIDELTQVTLIGEVTDPDNNDVLLAAFKVNGETVCADLSPDPLNVVTCVVALEAGDALVTLVAEDDSTGQGSVEITLKVQAGQIPEAAIFLPVQAGEYFADRSVELEGTVSDEETAPADLIVTWSSDQDGDLGNSEPDSTGKVTRSAELTEGSHEIKLTVVDGSEKVGTDTVNIVVQAANVAPICSFDAPGDGSAGVFGAPVSLEGMVEDGNQDVTSLTVTWVSDKDGTLGTSTPDSAGAVVFNTSALTAQTHELSMVVDDGRGGACSAAVTYIVGTPPTVKIKEPVDNDVFYTGKAVRFKAKVSDDLDASEDLTLVWESDLDKVLDKGSAGSDGMAEFIESDLSVGLHEVTLTATDSAGLFVMRTVVFEVMENTPPVIDRVKIKPGKPTADESLSCTWSGFDDVDGDPDQSSLLWTVNGTSVGSASTLASAEFEKGDEVACTVTPYDGIAAGVPVSASLTVSNSVPAVSDVVLSTITDEDGDGDDTTGVAEDTYECAYGFDDPDHLDNDESAAEWFVNGVSVGTGTTLPADVVGSDVVDCVVTPDDGEDAGTPVSVSLIVDHSAPSVSQVVLSPDPALAGDSLICSWDFSDADGDTDTSQVRWLVNGVDVGTDDELADAFVHGDEVVCEVTAVDAHHVGNVDSSANLTIENSAPVVSNVTVTASTDADADADDSTAVAADELLCSWDFDDVDGESDASTLAWTVGGVAVGTETNLAQAFVGHDEVICTVTPHDGTDAGQPESGSLTVDNSVPIVADVVVLSTTDEDGDGNDQSANASDTLTCQWTWSDDDGQADVSTVQWSVDSQVIGTGATVSSGFGSGDEVSCSVTPQDGEVAGAVVADTLLIDNTLPTVSNVAVTATTDEDGDGQGTSAVAADTLLCTWEFDDEDDHGDASTVAWSVDGQIVGTGENLAGEFVHADDVVCTVTPNDGYGVGIPDDASISIDNTPADVTNVSVTSSTDLDEDGAADTAVKGDTLVCDYDFADDDGHTDASTIAWWVNDGHVATSDTLNHTFVGGDTVSCVVTPNDGVETSADVTDPMVIDNTVPTVSDVVVVAQTDEDGDETDATAIATDTLGCSWSFSDVDGNDDASTVEWSNGSDVLGTESTLSGEFARDETITCTVTPHDGTGTGATASDALTIGNAVPSISNVSVTATTNEDGDEVATTARAADTLACTWDFEDVDSADTDGSTVEWSNGTDVLGTNVTLSGAFVADEVITCTVVAHDGTVEGNEGSGTLTLDNTPAVVTNAAVSTTTNKDGDGDSDTAVKGDILRCDYDYSDDDGHVDASTIDWLVNGSSQAIGATLDHSFVGGDTVTCVVTPNDGSETGDAINDELVIDNTAPSVSDVTVVSQTDEDGDGDETTAIASDTLICSWTFSDVDSGEDESTIAWSDGSNLLGTGITLTGGFARDETITCTVTPNDGTDDGEADSDGLVIDNAVPSVSSVAITSTTNEDGDGQETTAVAADTLLCSWDFDDVDEDVDASTVQWTDGTDVIGTDATLPGLIATDVVTCTVTAHDGTVQGDDDANTITLGNTPPVVVNVTVTAATDEDGDGNPETAVVGDTLLCDYDYSDDDGEEDASTIEWLVNGSTADTSATLNHGFLGGDTVTCVVTPNDGNEASADVTGDLFIDNTAPSVSDVTVVSQTDEDGDSEATTAIATDTLICSWSFSDVDSGDDESTLEWSDGSDVLGTGTTLTGQFERNDTITCTVTPNDGTDDGEPGSDGLTIGNAVPSVSNVSVASSTDQDGDGDAATAVVGDILACDYDYADVDGLTDASTIEWFVNAGSVDTGATLDHSFVGGDTVECVVTAHDGVDAGSDGSGELVIDDTSPTISNVTVVAQTNEDGDGDEDTAITTDTLGCSWNFADVDGAEDASTLEWSNGTDVLGTGTTLIGEFSRDETITCTVTPSDGLVEGTPDSDALTIDNALPVVTSVSVTSVHNYDNDNDNSTAMVWDRLHCAFSLFDADSDDMTAAVEWSNGTDVLGTGTTLGGLYSGVFFKDETITCTVTLNDGTEGGPPSSDGITIDNGAPVLAGVTVLSLTDADGDRRHSALQLGFL